MKTPPTESKHYSFGAHTAVAVNKWLDQHSLSYQIVVSHMGEYYKSSLVQDNAPTGVRTPIGWVCVNAIHTAASEAFQPYLVIPFSEEK